MIDEEPFEEDTHCDLNLISSFNSFQAELNKLSIQLEQEKQNLLENHPLKELTNNLNKLISTKAKFDLENQEFLLLKKSFLTQKNEKIFEIKNLFKALEMDEKKIEVDKTTVTNETKENLKKTIKPNVKGTSVTKNSNENNVKKVLKKSGNNVLKNKITQPNNVKKLTKKKNLVEEQFFLI
ncbi:hypothetical protein HDU92_006230 [Lobulomyces angularis]|nr:hypothetical protein HDU92_006230 [Lobulomyces angularis]